MTAGDTIAQRNALRVANPFAARLIDMWAEIAGIVCLVALLLAPALWNGFPIIFYDTGAYMLEGLGHVFMVERSPVYSVFLLWGGARLSLWLIAIVQSLATAFAMAECARLVAPRLTLGAFVALGAVLAVVTGLPWYAGEIEPDCFAPIAVLSLYSLAFGKPARVRGALLFLTAVLAIAVHPSHLMLAAGLTIVLAFYEALRRLPQSGKNWPAASPTLPVAACILSLALIVAANFAYTGAMFVSRAGPAFLFGRMLQDRIVMRVLDDTCPGSHYRLCAYKNVLPPSADGWMWGRDSPFHLLGRYAGTTAESEHIIVEAWRRYPLLNLEAAMADTARQFVKFKTGDQVEPQEWALRWVFTHFVPGQMDAYMSARQQQGRLQFHDINRIHVAIGYVSLAGLVFALGLAIARHWRETSVLLSFLLVALLGNAFICGVFATPHDRYQSRLIWLVPFALVLMAVERWTSVLQGRVKSAT